MNCLYVSVSLEKGLLAQHKSFNGTYKYLKQIHGQPIWRLLKFDDKTSVKLDTVYNAFWKNPKNSSINGGINGEWMIGKMKGPETPDFENPKIRGNECPAYTTPDKCKIWVYRNDKRINNKDKWVEATRPEVGQISAKSGINVTCMKGKKFLLEAISLKLFFYTVFIFAHRNMSNNGTV